MIDKLAKGKLRLGIPKGSLQESSLDLFARAGFEVVQLLGNFDRDPFRYGREQIWIVRRKRGD